ncbi:hypothetical protein [Flagellimonas eckloniae]|uniref:DUF4136 domain-containing protein n=1 Tax=Flagellimonas eckloniae TaxID=346185 RepID=A0A0Q0XC09_9FLAO|nr:hypothetical protein [Allomuricauda eckloniae]KQC28623.1 hypothetical protein AAY42_00915 [Allomuricauda eckloniae]
MTKYLYILAFILVGTGCSSLKLSDSYTSKDFESYRGKRVLVISRTPDDSIRKAYENEIASSLRRKGISAKESHLSFPNLRKVDANDSEKIEQLVARFRREGFDILLLTALKDVQEQVKAQRSEGHNSLLDYYGNKYITLRGYYDDMHAPPKLPPLEIEESTTYLTSTTYSLEAVIYNLALEDKKRLLSVLTTEITNPSSGNSVQKAFAKLITNELK